MTARRRIPISSDLNRKPLWTNGYNLDYGRPCVRFENYYNLLYIYIRCSSTQTTVLLLFIVGTLNSDFDGPLENLL